MKFCHANQGRKTTATIRKTKGRYLSLPPSTSLESKTKNFDVTLLRTIYTTQSLKGNPRKKKKSNFNVYLGANLKNKSGPHTRTILESQRLLLCTCAPPTNFVNHQKLSTQSQQNALLTLQRKKFQRLLPSGN